MRLEDSSQVDNKDEFVPLREAGDSQATIEDIVTPIEAGAQAEAEREFQTQRKLPPACKKAIVSVNGEDVNEVPIQRQDQAA